MYQTVNISSINNSVCTKSVYEIIMQERGTMSKTVVLGRSTSLFDFLPIDVPYEITVYTSDLSSAGTSANVFMALYGNDGNTEEIMLNDTKLGKKKDCFKKGSVDQFVKEVRFLNIFIFI